MRSEIFDNYVDIARKQGLISEAADSPRVGSDDLSTIELLYGVKPNGKDEKSIIEQAHPEPVIIAPAYDRLNGLVENEQERQNIIISIINKAPQAKLTQHRYAETQELMDELIRVGFLMDNKDQHDLMKLADDCTEHLLKKQALFPLLGGIAAGLALLGTYNNFTYLSQGVGNDCDNAMEAVAKFSQEVPEISDQLSELNQGIKFVKELYEKALKTAADIKSIKRENMVESAVEVHGSSIGKTAFTLLEQYKKAASILADRIMKVYVPIIQTTEPAQDRSSSSIWTGLSSAWHSLVGSKKNDALKALVGANIDIVGQGGLVGSLRKSVEQISAKEKAMHAYVEQNKGTLVDYLSEAVKREESSVTPKPAPKPNESVPKKRLIDELNSGPSKGMAI